jgi:hypothetical protein
VSTHEGASNAARHPRAATVLSDAASPLTERPAELGRLVTDSQLSGLLNIPRRTIQGWRRRGGGPPWVRVGRRAIRYDVVNVHAWLQSSRTSEPAP